MTNTTSSAIAPAQPRPVITEPTKTLLYLAAHIRSLREQMGIDYEEMEMGQRIAFRPGFSRPWLKPHPLHTDELSFDPDIYARTVNDCSDGERWCRLFILNVWNRAYAKEQGWHFDVMKAAYVLDGSNMKGICFVLQSSTWP